MSKKILIVDDDKITVKVLSDHFKGEGYDVEVAYDGVKGIIKTKEFSPDLILLDIVMSKMDGVTMLKKLKEDPKTEAISVLVLTNLETRESVVKALEAGNTEYLVKVNYNLEELSKRVGEALKNR